jgi:hypothetical protein
MSSLGIQSASTLTQNAARSMPELSPGMILKIQELTRIKPEVGFNLEYAQKGVPHEEHDRNQYLFIDVFERGGLCRRAC